MTFSENAPANVLRRKILKSALVGVGFVNQVSLFGCAVVVEPGTNDFGLASLAGLLGKDESQDLAKLVDVIIPTVDELPSGTKAGVLIFTAQKLKRYRDANATMFYALKDRMLLVAHGLRGNIPFQSVPLDASPQYVADALRRGDLPAAAFAQFRNDCFEAYFSHPRHRAGYGRATWDGIGLWRPGLPVLRNTDRVWRDDIEPSWT